MNEISGKFAYECDARRYHRFLLETKRRIVGTVYVQEHLSPLPDRLMDEYSPSVKKGGPEGKAA